MTHTTNTPAISLPQPYASPSGIGDVWTREQVRAAIEAVLQSRDREDSERFRWLTEDHADAETRTRCREILDRMAVMSYSSACAAIDQARRIEGDGE